MTEERNSPRDSTLSAKALAEERGHAVELVDPRPEWIEKARAEAERLGKAIGSTLVTVHHIGSTSIPGIKAKPIIDLLPVVSDLAVLDVREADVTALGYEWLGEFGLPGRRFLRLNRDGKRMFNVHCYEQSNPEIARHLAFRDYLRAHPGIAKAYEVEKIRAAAICPDDVLAYNDQKNAWIKETERRALQWYAEKW
jgi:GrpB-like predicted nucleotidyltransferase (UPF0157 family)